MQISRVRHLWKANWPKWPAQPSHPGHRHFKFFLQLKRIFFSPTKDSDKVVILRYILTPNRMFGDSHLVPSYMVIKIGMWLFSYFSYIHPTD